jgi:signal transduction histidine kinase
MVTLVVLLSLTIHGALLHLVATYARNLAQMEDRIDQLHTSVLQLTNANTEFLQQANTASEESAASERHRITRELHDVVGQTLTNIIMMMDATLHRKVHEPEETVKLLRWIRQQAKNGLQETRAVLYELRALRTQRLRGLKFLKKLVDTFTRLSGITTRVQWGNLPWAFDPEQELAVYHVLQGSLSNAFRHGTASVIEIQFQVSQGQLNLSVRDNGKGGSDSAPGIGQRSMEERLAPWGGTVSFHNEPFGYQVVANLPLQEEPGEPVQDSHR